MHRRSGRRGRRSGRAGDGVRAKLDALTEELRALGRDDVRFVLAGRAALPVFSCLGTRTPRLTGEVLIVSLHEGRWQQIGSFGGPAQSPVGAGPRFTLLEPSADGVEQGKNALFVGCSSNCRCSRED